MIWIKRKLEQYVDAMIIGAVHGGVFCLVLWLLDASITINF